MKNKRINKLKKKLESYRPGVEASKSVAFNMLLQTKPKVVPDKKKFNKKRERKNNKIKSWEV